MLFQQKYRNHASVFSFKIGKNTSNNYATNN